MVSISRGVEEVEDGSPGGIRADGISPSLPREPYARHISELLVSSQLRLYITQTLSLFSKRHTIIYLPT